MWNIIVLILVSNQISDPIAKLPSTVWLKNLLSSVQSEELGHVFWATSIWFVDLLVFVPISIDRHESRDI